MIHDCYSRTMLAEMCSPSDRFSSVETPAIKSFKVNTALLPKFNARKFCFSRHEVKQAYHNICNWINGRHAASESSFPLTPEQVKEIQAMPKGSRPDPEEYLPEGYTDSHLLHFSTEAGGASFLIPEKYLNLYGREVLGRSDGQFVMTAKEMDELIKETGGNISEIEKRLGIPSGAWEGEKLVRIDIPIAEECDLRMANGNEMGTNEEWIPGGFLPAHEKPSSDTELSLGYREAVTRQIEMHEYRAGYVHVHVQ